MSLLFLGLSSGGIALVVHLHDTSVNDVQALLTMSWPLIALVALLSVGTIFAEVLRFWVVARAVESPISVKAAWDATIANFFFAWITPGAALSEPATIYMLTRHGVPLADATVLTFTKTITGTSIIMGTAFILLAVGLGPALPLALYLPFVSGTGVFFMVAGAMWLGSKHPKIYMAWIERLCARIRRSWVGRWQRVHAMCDGLEHHTALGLERLQNVRRRGLRPLMGLYLTHLIYYSTFIGVLLALAYHFNTSSMWRMAALSIVYQVFIYVAPTPGGAGLSEATAEIFFGSVLRPQDAVICVVLFRTLTFYTHILIGLLYLPWMSGVTSIMMPKSEDADEPEVSEHA